MLNIPMSHTVGQFAMGDVWLEYTSDSYTNNENPVTEWSGKAGTTNFYLTTWNNCAMIQTGHSNGAATEDEQKLLANTLFYLAQLTGNNFCDDHKSQDFAAPDSVNISSVKVDGNSLVVNYSKSDDNGTEYEFYVKAINEYIGDEIISNTATAINTTGLAGYSYIIDNNQDTEPDNKVDTTDTSISVHLSELDLTIPVYIHIKAVDNAGNSSDTTHYEYTIKDKLEVKPKSVTLNKGSSKQLEAVLTSFSYEIQDVRWESSDEKVATVDSNGKVTAVGIGKCTIKAYITETDIMADCEVSVLKRPSGGSDSPNTTPKEVTVTEPPTTPVPAALPVDIAISLTSDKTTYTEHEEIIFTINYKNMLKSDTGPFEIIADILDNTTAVDSGAGEIKESTISWKIQNLAAEGSGKIVYKVKSGEISVDEVMISNTARISGNEGLINTDDDKSTVKVMLRKQKKLSHKAYVVGYPDGEFKPERHVTRAEVAVMFAKIMGLAPIKSEKKIYSDVETTHWASDYIQSATNAGIFIGYKDNSFHPDDPITRAEFATVVAKYMQVKNVKPFEEVYKDLSGHWAQNYIEEIKRLKIIEGYEDGTFRPDLPIKRSEAVTMINKMLFRGPLKVDIASFEDVPPTSWFFGQVEEAARDHEYYTENGYEVLAD